MLHRDLNHELIVRWEQRELLRHTLLSLRSVLSQMSSQNLLAMEGGVPFSPKSKAFDEGAVVARVSVDIESLELGEATPQARTPPRRTVSNPEAISEEEESQGFRDPPRRSSSNPLPQNSPGDRHREHFENLSQLDAPLLRMPQPPAQSKPRSPTDGAPEHLFGEEV